MGRYSADLRTGAELGPRKSSHLTCPLYIYIYICIYAVNTCVYIYIQAYAIPSELMSSQKTSHLLGNLGQVRLESTLAVCKRA